MPRFFSQIVYASDMAGCFLRLADTIRHFRRCFEGAAGATLREHIAQYTMRNAHVQHLHPRQRQRLARRQLRSGGLQDALLCTNCCCRGGVAVFMNDLDPPSTPLAIKSLQVAPDGTFPILLF